MLLWLKDCATGFCISEAQSIGCVRKNTSELNWPKPTTLDGSNVWKRAPSTAHLPLVYLLSLEFRNRDTEPSGGSCPSVQGSTWEVMGWWQHRFKPTKAWEQWRCRGGATLLSAPYQLTHLWLLIVVLAPGVCLPVIRACCLIFRWLQPLSCRRAAPPCLLAALI